MYKKHFILVFLNRCSNFLNLDRYYLLNITIKKIYVPFRIIHFYKFTIYTNLRLFSYLPILGKYLLNSSYLTSIKCILKIVL